MDCVQTSKEDDLKPCSVVLDSAEVVNFYCGITGGYRYHYVSSTPKAKSPQKSVAPPAPCTLEVIQDPETFIQSLLSQEPQIGCVFEKPKLVEKSSPPPVSKKIVKANKKCTLLSKRSKRIKEKHLKAGDNQVPDQSPCDVEEKVACAPILEETVDKVSEGTSEQTECSPVIPEQTTDTEKCSSVQSTEEIPVASVAVQSQEETSVASVALQSTEEIPEASVAVQSTEEIPVASMAVQSTEEIPVASVAVQSTEEIPVASVAMQSTEEIPVASVAMQSTEEIPVASVAVQITEEIPVASVAVQSTEETSVRSTEEIPVQRQQEIPVASVAVHSGETDQSTDTSVPTTDAATLVPIEAPKKKSKKVKKEKKKKNGGVCPDCQMVFRKWPDFIKHMSTEHDALKCTECGKDCQNLEELKEHQRSFHEPRQYPCHLCDMPFHHAITLKIHFYNLHVLNMISGAAAESSDSATFTSSDCSSSQIVAPFVAPASLPESDVPVSVPEVTSSDELSYTVMVEEEVASSCPADTTPSEIINLEEIEDMEKLQPETIQILPEQNIHNKSPIKKGARKSRFRNLHTPNDPEENDLELVSQVEVQNKQAKSREPEVDLKSTVVPVRSKEPKLVKSTSDGRYVAMGNLVYFKFRTKMFQMCCYTCGYNMKTLNDCVPHLRMAHALYVCRLCGDEFSKPEALKQHEVKQHKLENFICLACNLKFSNSEEKFRHYVSTHEEKKRCKPCNVYIHGEHPWIVHQALFHTPDLEWADCSPPFFNVSPPRPNDGIAKKRHLQKSGEEVSPAKRRIAWHSDISEANCLPNNVRSKVPQARHSVSDKLGMISPLHSSSLVVDKLSKNNTQIVYNSKCDAARKSVKPVVISRVSLANNSLLLPQVKVNQNSPQVLESNFQLLLPSQPPQVITQPAQAKKHIPGLKIVKRNTGAPQSSNSTPRYTIISSPHGSKFIIAKPESLVGLTDISVSKKRVNPQQGVPISSPSLTSGQSTKQDCDEIEVIGECRTISKHKKEPSIQNLNPKVVIAPLKPDPTPVTYTPRRPSILKKSLNKQQPKPVKLKSPRKCDVARSEAVTLQKTVVGMQLNSSTVETQIPVQTVPSSETSINIDPQLSNSVESLVSTWEMSLSNPTPSLANVTPDMVVDNCNNAIDEKSPESSQRMDRSTVSLKSNKCVTDTVNNVDMCQSSAEIEPNIEVSNVNTMEIGENSVEMILNNGDEASALSLTGEIPMEVATEIDVIASCTPTDMDQTDSTILPVDSNGTNVTCSPTQTDTVPHCNGQDIDITVQVSTDQCEITESKPVPKKKNSDLMQNNMGSIDDELCHVMDFSEPTEKIVSKPKTDMPVRQTEFLEQFLKFQNQNHR